MTGGSAERRSIRFESGLKGIIQRTRRICKMKRFLTQTAGFSGITAFFAAAFVFALAACSNLSDGGSARHTITFDSQGGSPVRSVTDVEGTQVSAPEPPTKPSHDFQGWFDAEAEGGEYAWPHTLTADVTMYARWLSGEGQETGGENTGKETGGENTGKETGNENAGQETGGENAGKETGGENAGNETGGGNAGQETGGGNAGKETGGGNAGQETGGGNAGQETGGGNTGEETGNENAGEETGGGNAGEETGGGNTGNETDPGTGNITIGFNYGTITISGNNGTNVIYKNSAWPDYITLSAAGYTDVKWYVDGGEAPVKTGNSVILDAINYGARTHYITFTGKKDDRLYSQTLPFTVRN
jgi:uncharacterized repeat protein (TIGR02543 family)